MGEGYTLKNKKKGIGISGRFQRVDSTSVTRTSIPTYFPAKSSSEEVATWGLYEVFSIWDKLNQAKFKGFYHRLVRMNPQRCPVFLKIYSFVRGKKKNSNTSSLTALLSRKRVLTLLWQKETHKQLEQLLLPITDGQSFSVPPLCSCREIKTVTITKTLRVFAWCLSLSIILTV